MFVCHLIYFYIVPQAYFTVTYDKKGKKRKIGEKGLQSERDKQETTIQKGVCTR